MLIALTGYKQNCSCGYSTLKKKETEDCEVCMQPKHLGYCKESKYSAQEKAEAITSGIFRHIDGTTSMTPKVENTLVKTIEIITSLLTLEQRREALSQLYKYGISSALKNLETKI